MFSFYPSKSDYAYCRNRYEKRCSQTFGCRRHPEVISVTDVHQLVSELSELPIRDIQLAFVDLFAQHNSINEFGILVAENRGLTIRSFDSEVDAEVWLLSLNPLHLI